MSKPSISTVIRPMQEGRLVERLPSSTREHRYRITPGGFTRVLQIQLDRMGVGAEAAEFGLSVIGAGRPEQRNRLEELRDFCEFSATEVRDEFMRRSTVRRKGESNEKERSMKEKVDFTGVEQTMQF